jgi:hypothetical protein
MTAWSSLAGVTNETALLIADRHDDKADRGRGNASARGGGVSMVIGTASRRRYASVTVRCAAFPCVALAGDGLLIAFFARSAAGD